MLALATSCSAIFRSSRCQTFVLRSQFLPRVAPVLPTTPPSNRRAISRETPRAMSSAGNPPNKASGSGPGRQWPPAPAQAVEVHDFWFDGNPAKGNHQLWFSGGPEADSQVKSRFGSVVEAAISGNLPGEWDQSPMAACSKVILLDQFSRNVFRGSTKAFEGDAAAQQMAKTIADNPEFIDSYTCHERTFAVILPFMHSEVLENHELAAELLSTWMANCTEEEAKVYSDTHEFLMDHTRVIRRFGRYPSRNASLGRSATQEEEEYMRTEAKGWELSQAKTEA